MENLSLTHYMERVEHMFLAVHLHSSLWGSSIFLCQGKKNISFNDGFRCPIPEEIKRNSKEILTIFYETTLNEMYLP